MKSLFSQSKLGVYLDRNQAASLKLRHILPGIPILFARPPPPPPPSAKILASGPPLTSVAAIVGAAAAALMVVATLSVVCHTAPVVPDREFRLRNKYKLLPLFVNAPNPGTVVTAVAVVVVVCLVMALVIDGEVLLLLVLSVLLLPPLLVELKILPLFVSSDEKLHGIYPAVFLEISTRYKGDKLSVFSGRSCCT